MSGNRYEWHTHRTNDPTNYLKVRVTLSYEKRNKSKTSPNSGTNPETSDDSMSNLDEEARAQQEAQQETKPGNQKENPQGGHIKKETITREISWQERIFSPIEVQQHKQDSTYPLSSNSQRSDKIHDAIGRELQKDSHFLGSEIFTRTKDDDYIDPSEIDYPVYVDIGSRPPTDLAEAILENKGPQSVLDVVHTTATSMHIFGAIKNDEGYSEELLGIIRVYAGGRIDVRPPFSNKTEPRTVYKFYSKNSQQVEYTFEVIEDIPEKGSLYDETLKTDISRRRAVFENMQAECLLAQPPEADIIRIFYMGQIVLAKMDNIPGVMIDWTINLPSEGWQLEESELNNSYHEQNDNFNDFRSKLGPLRYCSQYALCNDDGIAHINFPIEFTALCATQVAPTINVELHSFNSKGSRIVVGYGTAPLPIYVGKHTIKIKTWRIKGTISQELKLQFLDSGLQKSHEPVEDNGDETEVNKALNMFGLKTIGTGEVVIEFNIIMQSTLFKRKINSSLLNPMSTLGSEMPREPFPGARRFP